MELLGLDLSMTWILLIGVILMFVWYDWRCHQYFQRRGIPVADYVPIFGNNLQLRHGILKAFAEYERKHGKVVGTYDFRRPILIINEPEILQHILVKNFSNFYNRRKHVVIQSDRTQASRGMFFLEDEEWKTVRNTLTPSFTAAKMKNMFPLINECCDTLLTSISEAREGGKAVDCKMLFGGFTMDVIACCAFGLSVNSQQDKDNPFVKNAKVLLDPSRFRGASIILMSMLPILAPVFTYFGYGLAFEPEAVQFFQGVTEAACKLRLEEGAKASKHADLLQLMLNAHHDTDVDQEDTPTIGDGPKRGVVQRRPLSTENIMAQSLTFFLAGYETTNTLLSFTAFLLATNQDAQERLNAEIDNLDPTSGNIGYDVIGKMEYLDMVINESLRMYPPVIFIDRQCNQKSTFDGLVIENGMHVFASVWNIHRNEEYWTDPEKFDPERFSPENKASIKPCTYMPFGFGPRICFGMRFALLEAKMALVRVLQQYRFDVCSETEIPPALGTGLLLTPKEMVLNIIPRN
ncbi:cytochrome P450 3A29-like [Patiria miniata]|uniref:Thromboxane-A synthase n=1 Tax=Patiria miniata TaxID=46514 RepID=A0A914ATP5_PATMI|nr:cytochrome P450 3A29-like [Patiria miniata]